MNIFTARGQRMKLAIDGNFKAIDVKMSKLCKSRKANNT